MAITFAPWARADTHGARDARRVASPDGVIVVALRRTPAGLFVERVIQRPGTSRVVQVVTFDTLASFRRWCDANAARFEYPQLFSKLIHDADELFADHAEARIAC